MIISGTVSSAVQLQAQNSKWLQKKESGNVLSKEERNARENWTQDDWLKYNYEQQAAQNRETGKRNQIDNKILSGGSLTPEEEKYLEQESPATLQKYKEVKAEKKAFEEKLKNCKTKDEVQEVKTETLGEYAASMKKVENDPCIPLSEKLAKAKEILAKTKNLQEVELKFIQSSAYDRLPTQAEETNARLEDWKQNQEQAYEAIDEAVSDTAPDTETVSGETAPDTASEETAEKTGDDAKDADIIQDMEDTYRRIRLNVRLDDDSDSDLPTDSERKIGGQINITA